MVVNDVECRRSKDFVVRRWFAVGAASAGLTAALYGLALAGPQIGVALAEESGSSPSSASAQVTADPVDDDGESSSSSTDPAAGQVDSGGAPNAVASQSSSDEVPVDDDGSFDSSPGSAFASAADFYSGLHANLPDPVQLHENAATTDGKFPAVAFAQMAPALTPTSLEPTTSLARLAGSPEPAPKPSDPPASTPPASARHSIQFEFEFPTSFDSWTQERRDALTEAATRLGSYFRVPEPVKLRYVVRSEDDPQSSTLAYAKVDLRQRDGGFAPTVVQDIVFRGTDTNGALPEGTIVVNWANPWDVDDDVDADRYDFQAVLMHELLHTFGFYSSVKRPKTYEGSWTVFDSFIVDSTGNKIIGSDFLRRKTSDPNLTGDDGGLYFGGPNAVAAYGKPVPLYTPSTWEPGSSVSHLDDVTFTYPNNKMMNAGSKRGPDVRVLSPVELGIMKDLGYDVLDAAAAPKTTDPAKAM